MPTQTKFISEHGYETYSTAHEERTRLEIEAKFADAKAEVQNFVNQKKDEINARVATVAPMVDGKTEGNVSYIYQHQSDWTEGEVYILPDADPETGEQVSVVYSRSTLYIG